MADVNAKTVRIWYRVHKWTSLICTALLLVACVTGLPLVFEEELDSLLEPHVAPAPSTAGAPMASIDPMVVRAQAQFPSLHPFSIVWDDDELVIPECEPNHWAIRVEAERHLGRWAAEEGHRELFG